MNKKKKPKTWAEVYPMGTKEGNEEAKFFRSLARNKKYTWRSTAALAKESNLTKERTEEIIAKYLKRGMIFQSSKNETMWAYWERVPELLPNIETSLSAQDKKMRIDKAAGFQMGIGTIPPAYAGPTGAQGATGAQGPVGVGPKGPMKKKRKRIGRRHTGHRRGYVVGSSSPTKMSKEQQDRQVVAYERWRLTEEAKRLYPAQ